MPVHTVHTAVYSSVLQCACGAIEERPVEVLRYVQGQLYFILQHTCQQTVLMSPPD